MVRNYESFLESKKTVIKPDGLPEEVVNSCLIIARSMYDKVKKYSFFNEDDEYYIKFEVTPMDFKYVDPTEVLPLDLSAGAMERRRYYVELSYDDQIPSTNEVIYKIIFENMSPDRFGKVEDTEEEFVDNYEEEIKRQREEDDFDINDLE